MHRPGPVSTQPHCAGAPRARVHAHMHARKKVAHSAVDAVQQSYILRVSSVRTKLEPVGTLHPLGPPHHLPPDFYHFDAEF